MTVFFLLHLLIFIMVSEGVYDCRESRCGSHGPSIHFPFRLNDEPEFCGYPGFELSCDSKNNTILTLPNSVRLFIREIDYMSQKIDLYDPERCLVFKLLHLDLPASHFFFDDEPYKKLYDFSIFKCSGVLAEFPISPPCASDTEIFAITYSLSSLPPTPCKKIHEIPSVPNDIVYSDLPLYWLNPICKYCEGLEMDCGFKNYTNQLTTRCFNRPSTTKGTLKEPLIAGGVLGLILLGIIMMAFYEFYSSSKTERENQARVEKFLEDYRAHRPSRYTYADIKKVTNMFQERLGEGAYGVVYKGTLSNEIHVAVKVLNGSEGNGEEFINEVAAMGKIHHVNVVRLVGFCADGYRRALVYEYMPNQSLDKLIFSESSKQHTTTFNWNKLHDIATGIAKGLEYLHQGCDQQILHFDIKPQNILLDHNWNPKISDFGLAKLCAKEKSAVTMTEARGTMGYIAPEVVSSNFGKASHKSDVYSFGMLLLEMVGGRKNFDAKVDTSQMNFPEWIHQRLNQGEELKIRIEEEDDIIILKKLAIVGLWCIQWNATDRPSIKVVTQMLEEDGSDLTIPPLSTARKNTHIGAGAIASPLREELTVIPELE